MSTGPAVGLLQPLSTALSAQANSKATTKLGATWADTSGAINIDVDNLLAPRSPKAGPAPSINQLKSTPNSPAHNLNPTLVGYNFQPMMNNNFAAPNMNVTNPNIPSMVGSNIGSNMGMNMLSPGMNNNLPFVNQNSFLQ